MNKISNLLKEKSYLRILEAHNGISARLVEQSQFDGIWESSLTDSGSKGLPDNELVSIDSRLETTREICNVSTKPLILDGDTGGCVEHFPYHVRMMEKSGASAVIIEDKKFPKRNSLDNSAKHFLEEVDIFAKKIQIGKNAAQDFLIIARLEGLLLNCSQDELLFRTEAYLKAGADGIMIHSKKDNPDEVLEFARNYRRHFGGLLVAVPTTYNLSYEQIVDHDFGIIIYANHLFRSSLRAMSETIKLMEEGKTAQLASINDIFNITDYDNRRS
jgi:phosphoenolpyruvate phosphomutase